MMHSATNRWGKKRKNLAICCCKPKIPSTLTPSRMKPSQATQNANRLLKHTSEGECGFLWYARLRSGTIYRHPFFTKWTFEVEEDKLFFRAGLDQSLDSLMYGFTESIAPTIRPWT